MKWPNKKYKIGENHLCRSVFFCHADFADATCPVVADPLRLEKVPQISQIYTDFFIGVFCPTDFTDLHRFFLGRLFFVTQISQMTQIFSHGIFFHRMPRNLFGGFLLRRLLTDFRRCDLSGRCRYTLRLENIPQISQIYTDFSWDVFFSHADFADDADFFSWDFLFIGFHGIYSEVSCWDD